MSVNLAGAISVAEHTRSDFESGRVSEDEIVKASTAFDWVHNTFRTRILGKHDFERQISEGTLGRVGHHVIPVPALSTDGKTFPNGWCNIATPVLAQCLVESGSLGGRIPNLVHGGCGEDEDALDITRLYHNQHTFLHIGETALGPNTICDITADQFNFDLSPVYIGPLSEPWTDNPRFDMDNY